MKDMEHRINRDIMIGWSVIVAILAYEYLKEYLNGIRSRPYLILFDLLIGVPLAVCLVLYFKNKSSRSLRYCMLAGYSIMYAFVLFTGSTNLVFTFVFPLLSLIVLYHQPSLVLAVGVFSLVVNLANDVKLYLNGMITAQTGRDIEIQLSLLFFCFGFLYVTSRLYNDIHQQNIRYMREIEEKNKEIQEFTLESITTIANIIDAKDEYTKGHSQRVAEYASAIAREMGYSEESVVDVRYIALMHDIGKVGISDNVLKKPGRLDADEFELMKHHVDIGARILHDNHLIEGLEVGAKYHHEKYNGKGYGEGLKGNEIPEIARIIGIADAYDAMTTNRVYRKRLSNEEVISELKKNSGSQFDPKITEIFIELLEQGKIKNLSPNLYAGSEGTE